MSLTPPSQSAFIFWDHFEEALQKVKEVRDEEITPELLEVLIHNHDYFFKQMKEEFGLSIRYALTASCIRKKERRELYGSALSYYYNPRAIWGARRARRRPHAQRPRRTKPIITTNQEGQMGFLV